MEESIDTNLYSAKQDNSETENETHLELVGDMSFRWELQICSVINTKQIVRIYSRDKCEQKNQFGAMNTT